MKPNKPAGDRQYLSEEECFIGELINLIYILTINLIHHQSHECGPRTFKVHFTETETFIYIGLHV